MEARPKIIVVLGPTGGGKSEVAVALAERMGVAAGPVIGADSMQVYRHLDAGTAKPEAALRARVRHVGIDAVEPTEPFSVADWLAMAEAAVTEAAARGAVPVVAGGTHLYVRALLEGLMDGPGRDDGFRASLEPTAEPVLRERLAAVDPPAAARIERGDRRRLIRALEVHHVTGRPISDWQAEWSDAPRPYRFAATIIGIRWPVEAINGRINARVRAMFDDRPEHEGLVQETERLERCGLLGPQAREALGTKQCLAYLQHRGRVDSRDMLDGKIRSVDDAVERTKILTRRFAKQQRTWFKRFRGVRWVEGASAVSEALALLPPAPSGPA